MFEWLKNRLSYPMEPPDDAPIARAVGEASCDPLGRSPAAPTLSSATTPSIRYSYDNGSKWQGGFGATELLTADYWTLRARSVQLFETNLYARGVIRRLVTNEINTGLHLEAKPVERVLGRPEDSLVVWTEDIETRFELWGKTPRLCDHNGLMTFGQLQRTMRSEALITGDVLVVLRQHKATGLPRVQLISGAAVQTPLDARPKPGNRIEHGVELDKNGRQVAYWIVEDDPSRLVGGRGRRLPAYGEKSGRRLAWLVYGTDRRLDTVRGKPILSLVLQSLREIERYRDSTTRKAVINSMLAMFIEKAEPRVGSQPITGGAVRRAVETMVDSAGTERSFRTADLIPGLVLDELQHGETPKAFPSNGTDEKFGDFERAIVVAIAWANEIPPEILMLSFGSNYSASQAAINEFKLYLNKVRTEIGEVFCQSIYADWLLSSMLTGKVTAPGLLESWRTLSRHDELAAWTNAEWAGHIKPAVDLSKLVRGYGELVDRGWITHDRAARELTGTKFSQNAKQLRRENEALAEARAPMVALEAQTQPAPDDADDAVDDEAPNEGGARDDERQTA